MVSTVRDPSLDTLPRETFVPFVRQGNLILVNGSINHKPVTMIFDTGAAGCLFSKATLKSLGIRIPANLQAATVAGVGTNKQTEAWIMPVDLKLGSIERRQFSVHINDNPLNYPLLGVNFLQGFEYTINTNSNIIQFKLVNKNETAEPPVPVSSSQLRKENSISWAQLTGNLTSKPVITVDSSCRYIYTVPFVEHNGAIIILVKNKRQGMPNDS